MYKIGNIGIIANFVFQYIRGFFVIWTIKF